MPLFSFLHIWHGLVLSKNGDFLQVFKNVRKRIIKRISIKAVSAVVDHIIIHVRIYFCRMFCIGDRNNPIPVSVHQQNRFCVIPDFAVNIIIPHISGIRPSCIDPVKIKA